jgi:hypothetical protein
MSELAHLDQVISLLTLQAQTAARELRYQGPGILADNA